MARALGAANATVYVTGRTVRGGPRPGDGAAGTVDGVAEEVTQRGGRGIAVPCDHADDAQVALLSAGSIWASCLAWLCDQGTHACMAGECLATVRARNSSLRASLPAAGGGGV